MESEQSVDSLLNSERAYFAADVKVQDDELPCFLNDLKYNAFNLTGQPFDPRVREELSD